jgi:hypothetical protein
MPSMTRLAVAKAACAATALLSSSLPNALAAEELPAMRRGQWEFSRYVVRTGAAGPPKVTTAQKCSDPGAVLRQSYEFSRRMGCKFSDITKRGHVYTYRTECHVGGGISKTQTILTASSNSTYELQEVISREDGSSMKSVLKGHRLGDC